MDSSIQVYLMMMLLTLYAALGAIPIILYMAVVTYIKKNKSYIKKNFDEEAREDGWI